MRWIPFLALVYATLIVQTTVGRMLTFSTASIGAIGPDFLAMVVVFVALHARSGLDAALAAWAAGLGLDLVTAGGASVTTAVGPMAIAYVLAATAIFRAREAFFRDRPLPQALLALLFCLLAHAIWLTAQSLLAGAAGGEPWRLYPRRMIQASVLAVYTAVLMPAVYLALGRVQGLILAAVAERSRRR